jgi:hypothetical protein
MQEKEIILGIGLTIIYREGDENDACFVQNACSRALPVINNLWNLSAPKESRILITCSPIAPIFRFAPWYRKLYYGITFIFWTQSLRDRWRTLAAFTSHNWIAMKPIRALVASDASIGKRIFHKTDDPETKLTHIVSHELTHVCSRHLKLPMWLNEGLALLTTDVCLGQNTIRSETLEILGRSVKRYAPQEYARMTSMTEETIVAHYARGYWITRYFREQHPETLRSLLSQRLKRRQLEEKLAAAVGLERLHFWDKIDKMVFSHYTK